MSVVNDLRLARKLKAAGFQNSLRTIYEARRADLPLSYALAFLEKESAKGQNVFGHDPVRNPIKGGKVTKSRYLQYKRYRQKGFGMQGVGPMQLTYYTLQDEADHLGGCWKPKYNMRVGFKLAASLIKEHGKYDGVTRYNGSGAAAHAYANDWLHKQKRWHRYVS
jgi:hypothetical protein